MMEKYPLLAYEPNSADRNQICIINLAQPGSHFTLNLDEFKFLDFVHYEKFPEVKATEVELNSSLLLLVELRGKLRVICFKTDPYLLVDYKDHKTFDVRSQMHIFNGFIDLNE